MRYTVMHGRQGRTQEEWCVGEADTLAEAIDIERRFVEFGPRQERAGYVYVRDAEADEPVIDGTWIELDKGDNPGASDALRSFHA